MSDNKTFFYEAGSFPDLSYTELCCVLSCYGINKEDINRFSNKLFLIRKENFTDSIAKTVFDRLGGCVRYGVLLEDLDSFLDKYFQKEEKVVFGISILDHTKKEDYKFVKKLGRQIKDGFKENNVSSRFVLPMKNNLSLNAAQIDKNNILTKGFELTILRNNTQEIYGQTLKVQNIEEYAERDMDKPFTDVVMGTLPPKLARMMVNFTSRNKGILWDPFCGSGTIALEALLSGFDVLASDIDYKAVKGVKENISWLNRDGLIDGREYNAFQMDITKANKGLISKLKKTNIDAVVCEPFMGPPQKHPISEQLADELLSNVENLYKHLFTLLDVLLSKRGEMVVIIIPSYQTKSGFKTFSINKLITNRWKLRNSYYVRDRGLKWSRKNSIIQRNIYILERS